MATITRPASLRIGPSGCYWGLQRFDIEEVSDVTGSSAARPLGPPRWVHGMQSGDLLSQEEWADWAIFMLQLKGLVNVVGLYDPVMLAPSGTIRGTLTLSGAHAAGAASVTLTGGAGQAAKTLLRGDRIGIGTGHGTSQVVMATSSATANGSGVLTVAVEPALRIAFSNGAAVAWDKPLVYFRLAKSAPTRWTYSQAQGRQQGGFAADFMESFGL